MDFGAESVAPVRIGERIGKRVGGQIFRRWLGAWIDFFGAAFCGFLLGSLIHLATQSGLLDGLALLVGVVGYYWVLEAMWGRTLGKIVTGLIVVTAEGEAPGFGRAGVRTALRLIEVNPFLLGGIPAGLVAANSKAGQRIGDMLAKTYVVPLRELKKARLPAEVSVFS